MKRLQIYIEAESDAGLGAQAARDGLSKAAIIRSLVADHLGRNAGTDPIDDLVGCFGEEPGRVDDVVYGP